MSPCCVAPSSPYSRTLEQCNTASCDNHEIIKSCVCFSFLYEYGSPLDSPAPLTQMQQSDWLSYATKLVFHCVCIDSGISRKICVLVFVPTTLVLKWAAPKSGLLLCFFFYGMGGGCSHYNGAEMFFQTGCALIVTLHRDPMTYKSDNCFPVEVLQVCKPATSFWNLWRQKVTVHCSPANLDSRPPLHVIFRVV